MHPAIRPLLIILLLTVVFAEPGDRMQCGPKFPPAEIARILFPTQGYSLEEVSLRCIALCTCLHYAPNQFEVYCDHNIKTDGPLVEYCRENCRCSPHLLTGPVEPGPGNEGEGQSWGVNTRRRTGERKIEELSRIYEMACAAEDEAEASLLDILSQDSCESSTSPSRKTKCYTADRSLTYRNLGINSKVACEAKERTGRKRVTPLYEESFKLDKTGRTQDGPYQAVRVLRRISSYFWTG